MVSNEHLAISAWVLMGTHGCSLSSHGNLQISSGDGDGSHQSMGIPMGRPHEDGENRGIPIWELLSGTGCVVRCIGHLITCTRRPGENLGMGYVRVGPTCVLRLARHIFYTNGFAYMCNKNSKKFPYV